MNQINAHIRNEGLGKSTTVLLVIQLILSLVVLVFYPSSNLMFLWLALDMVFIGYGLVVHKDKLRPSFRHLSLVQVATVLIVAMMLFFEYREGFLLLLIFSFNRLIQFLFPNADVYALTLKKLLRVQVKHKPYWTGMAFSVLMAVVSILMALFLLFLVLLFSDGHNYAGSLTVPVFCITLLSIMERIWKFRMWVANTFQLIIIVFVAFTYLQSWKCIWPNDVAGGKDSRLGISERPARKVLTGGWMDGFYWMQFETTPSEVKQIVNSFTQTHYEQNGGITIMPLLKDSVLRVPTYGVHGNPWFKLTNPCEHWYAGENRLPVSIMYDKESGIIEIFEQTED